MEKIWNFVKNFNYLQLMLILVTLRAIVFAPTIADAFILVPLAALAGLNRWLGDVELKKVNDYVIAELQEIKARMVGVNAFQRKNSEKNKPIDNFWS